jgi:hypothetical protein
VSATSPSSEVQHWVRSLSRAALEAELGKFAAAQAEREQLSQAYAATKFELAL